MLAPSQWSKPEPKTGNKQEKNLVFFFRVGQIALALRQKPIKEGRPANEATSKMH
jgi:hypothetical protein